MQASLTKSDDGIAVRAVAPEARYSPFVWRLVYYPPHARLAPHRHDVAQLSVLLSGAAREITQKGEFDSSPMVMEFKPANFSHANEFGPDGALMLSINVDPDDEDLKDGFGLDKWRIGHGSACQAEWAMLARIISSAQSKDAHALEMITHDLMTSISQTGPSLELLLPPDWLARARDAIVETEDSIQTVADDAGVHRVHLARSFRRYFGQSISQVRREARLSRAVKFLAHDNIAPGPASFAAGYSDQSHLTRSLRAAAGLTPAELRSIFDA